MLLRRNMMKHRLPYQWPGNDDVRDRVRTRLLEAYKDVVKRVKTVCWREFQERVLSRWRCSSCVIHVPFSNFGNRQ